MEEDCKKVRNLSGNYIKSLFVNYILDYRLEKDLCVKCGAELKDYPSVSPYHCFGCDKTIQEKKKEVLAVWIEKVKINTYKRRVSI